MDHPRDLQNFRLLCSGFEPVGTLRFSELRSEEAGGIVIEGIKSCSVECNGPGKAAAGGRALNREVVVVAKRRKRKERVM
ncbi:hypothetical protein L1887_03958 [Cichorium endivia]|nr:hypothetical protein L1887_03958 [Cichorium endivia]